MVKKLVPVTKSYLWGGTKLKSEYGKICEEQVLAESWELSCHKDGESIIANGAYGGRLLREYIAENPTCLGKNAERYGELPIMIKLINAEKPLSVQVHPDDGYAKKNEHSYGKTEMWVVLDALPDSFVYYGLTYEISKEEFYKRIEEDTLCEVLNKVPVKKDDVIFIEPGIIHAIGANITIAEIQQSSNITYRIYDYGRKDEYGQCRQLHIEKASEVTKLSPPPDHYNFGAHIGDCEYFVVDRYDLDGELVLESKEDSFLSILITQGVCTITDAEEGLYCLKGDSIFIPANSGAIHLSGKAHILVTKVGSFAPAIKECVGEAK